MEKLAAVWTNDCQGKKDYDGDILSISTRYWPRGGGFTVVELSSEGVKISEGAAGIEPAATCSLVLWHADPIHSDPSCRDYTDLVEKEFEGGSFEEIAPQVEAWAQEQMDIAVDALKAVFDPNSSSVLVRLSAREKEVLDQEATVQEMSREGILRQGLRLVQLMSAGLISPSASPTLEGGGGAGGED